MAPLYRLRAASRTVSGARRFAMLRRLPLLAAIGLMALDTPQVRADTQMSEERVVYDIPAGSLADVLRRYAQQSGSDIVIDATGALAGRSSDGLQGRHGVAEGFDILLRGTGYRAVRTGAGYVLQALPAEPSAGVSTLDAVTVQGQSVHSAATDGSDSYAARYVSLGKGTQSWREIPQSVSVMTRSQMDDMGAVTVAEAMGYVTGLTQSDYEGTEKFNARGFATSAQFDGVPQQDFGTHLDLAIYDRVEVLRGPSGLLTGTGEPGGAINYARKRPRDAAHGSVALTTGSWSYRRAEVDGGGLLNEAGTLRGRVVGAWQQEDKFYELGRNAPRTLYGVIELDLSERTTLGVAGTWHERQFRNFNGLPLYADGSLPGRDDYVGSDRLSRYREHDYSLDLTHRFDNGWTAKATYMHRRERYRGYSAFAGSALETATGRAGVSAGRIANDFEWDQGDLQVSGPVRLLGQEHWLALGYNSSRYESTTGSRFVWLPDWVPLQDHDFGTAFDAPVTNFNRSVTKQSGLYSTARIRLAEPLTLVLGGRWTDYRLKSRQVAPVASSWTHSVADVDSEFTPFGGLVWDVADNMTVYASYADIFVPQDEEDVGGQTLRPRVGWQAEAGVKGEFLDGRLNASLAVFRIRDTNRAITDDAHIGCGGTPNGACYRAAGKVQSQGVEMEISGRLSAGWDVMAGYTYTDAKYLSDSDPANAGRRFGADVLPRHLLRLWTHYRFGPADLDGALTGWRIGAGLQAQSSVQTSSIRQGAYATVSLRLGYRFDEHWDASLAVNNLFDRTYLRTPGHATFYNLYGAPRNAMLTLRYAL